VFIPLSVERLHKRFPVMTVSIIGANLAAFLVASISAWGDGGFWRRWALVPCQHGPFSHQVFVSLFLHVGWLHLLVNMWFLFIYGAGVEDACGRVRLLLLYLISGLAGQGGGGALTAAVSGCGLGCGCFWNCGRISCPLSEISRLDTRIYLLDSAPYRGAGMVSCRFVGCCADGGCGGGKRGNSGDGICCPTFRVCCGGGACSCGTQVICAGEGGETLKG